MNPREFAERALLGVLISEPSRISSVGEWLSPDDFRSPAHSTIYRHIQDLAADTNDSAATAVTLLERIARSGELGTQAVNAPNLHTLMATAPPPQQARPEMYGLMVLEASIRRRVEHSGMRVGQHVEQASDMTAMLDTVQAALTEVEHAQRRWDLASGRSPTLDRLLNAADETRAADAAETTSRDLPALIEPPDPDTLHNAEEAVITVVLNQPPLLDNLNERLVPEDFADQALASTYRSALELHARGEHIDMVTVAWEQQRHDHAHGPGVSPDRMLSLAHTTVTGDPSYHADLVMRGSLARLTRSAAATVREAAQHPGLQPGDLLHTTRMAYQAIGATAERMNGRGSAAARLAGLSSPVPLSQALRDGQSGEKRGIVSPARPLRPNLER